MDNMEIVSEKGEIMSLPDHYKSIPLHALRISSRKKLAKYLNIQAEVVDDETGHVSDYMGLGELIGFDYLEIKNFERQKSPTEELLDAWSQREDLQPTLGNLWKYLIELGRLDVLEDCTQIITTDIERFIQIREHFQDDYKPLQEDTVSQSTETAPDHYVDETLILAKDDVIKGCPQFFDAFVCYNPEGGDLQFVKEMIKVLEGPTHKLKLFVPWRDDLPGGARFVIDAKLIESRCRRMVIIMSRNYIKSSACDFQVKFAHALSPGARSKKLIPVLIEPSVKIPQILRHVTLCDFTKQDLMEWFWDRLAKAIKAPLEPEKPPNSVSSSSIDIGASASLDESINAPGIEFPISGHQQVRSQLEELGESTNSASSSPLSTTSTLYSMDWSQSPGGSSLGSSMGSYPDSGFNSSHSCPSIGSYSEVAYQKNMAVIRPQMSQPATAPVQSTSPQKKSGIFSGIFHKKKKHSSHHTSSNA